MSENDIDKTPLPGEELPEMNVNPHDGAVSVDEKDRTVFLTETETIIVEKPTLIDIAPSNRPRKVYGGMWGPTEIGVVGAGFLVLVAALAIYMFFVVPANRELEQNKATRDRLEAELASAREKYGSITTIEGQVAKLVSSVDDFETRFLPLASNGRTALYQKLNGLIAGYGLINTSGPDYSPLEISDQSTSSQSEEETGRGKYRSLFPGAYVSMTLEGPYSNLRRFIRDIETGNDFVIISAVELEPSDSQQTESNQPAAQQPADANPGMPPGFGGIQTFPGRGQVNPSQPRRPTGRTVGQVVSLRMEMAAYFRRPTMESQVQTAP